LESILLNKIDCSFFLKERVPFGVLPRNGGFIGMVGKVLDLEAFITNRKEQPRSLEVHSPVGIFHTDRTGAGLYVNDRWSEMTGLSAHEAKTSLWTEGVHPEDRPWVFEKWCRVSSEGIPFTAEYRIQGKEGTVKWILCNAVAEKGADGEIVGSIGVIIDITERKKAEEALKNSKEKLRFLASQLIKIQEKERRKISIELQDDLGQSLIGLKFQLSHVAKQLRKDQSGLKLKIEGALKNIDGLTENIRRISKELRPALLEHLGLGSALQWLFDSFSEQYYIPILNHIKEADCIFSQEQEVIIFRIFQEALANIRKHAQATRIAVTMTLTGKKALFSIQDNGKGFNLQKIMNGRPSQGGLGLIAMDEQVRMTGGNLEIKSRIGDGTRIIFSVPGER
jgi:two-component system, NarL family, sensor histidine kinase UhpB